MSERLPEPEESLRSVEVHGKSLAEWHKWLTTDTETGEPTGHLQAPCSRYGRNGDECAWWAIACELIYVSANGADDEPETSLDFYMGFAVNDSEQVAYMVDDYYYAIPDCLREVIGTHADIKQLINGDNQ